MVSGHGATIGECVAVLEASYPPRWAASWDAVGMVVGDPDAPVETVLFAVDPTVEVAKEAAKAGAGLLVTHHPLFLRAVHGVAETSVGGRVVATLVRAGAALFVAHTNADVAVPGVSDALAAAIGLRDVVSLASPNGVPGDGVPGDGDAGDGDAGDGDAGDGGDATRDGGLGRIGDLPRVLTLAEFCAQVAASLPSTASGVRTTGDPERPVRRVAVCGGSGGELVAAAEAAGADVFVTADARHHHTLDATAAYGTAVVDVAHWASEWPWLASAARRLRTGLVARGRTVNTMVSMLATDPWRWHVACR